MIRSVDAAAAARLPGVVAIFTGADLERDGIGAIPPAVLLPGRGGKPMFGASMPVLAAHRVRYVGEPVAIVVAETAAQALDAAEAVVLEVDELRRRLERRARGCGRRAGDLGRGAGQRLPGLGRRRRGRGRGRVREGRARRASEAPRHPAWRSRAMEPRAAIGAWDAASERYTLTAGTQGVALVRKMLAESVFKVPPQQIRVLTHDVGGGFGMKVQVYPEYAAVLYAARRIGRPVKWRASRLESFLADTPGRDGLLEGELALDADGKFLALRVRTAVGIGAYASTFSAVIATNNTKNCLSSVYVIPAIHIGVKMIFTNAMPLGPYRGAGRPEAIYLIERLIEVASRTTGIDRVTLRRRNLIPPTAMPYQAPNSPVYDSGEFEAVLDKALALADWNGLRGAARGVRPRGQAARDRAVLLPRGRGRQPAAGHRGSALRGGRQGRAPARRAGDRAGASHDLPAGRRAAARHRPVSAVRLVQGDSDEVPARPADGRVALDDDGRRVDGDGLRPVDREGAEDRERTSSRPPPWTSSSPAGSFA